jgi:ELWxxDGT repeat protein
MAFLYLLLSATVLGSWVSVAEAQLRRCLALLILYLLVSAAWTQPVGAQPTLVKDINLFPPSSSPREFIAIGSVVYFVAGDSVTGVELWRSNGTAAGTLLVKNIRPGTASSVPSSLTNVNGVLYFVADNGLNGREVWRSNGTAVDEGSGDWVDGCSSCSPSSATFIMFPSICAT